MPLKVKIKVLGIIISSIALFIYIYWSVSLVSGIIYLGICTYILYKMYPKFDFSSDIKFNKNKKLVSLTFDDGPTEGFTQDILNILKEKDVPASFFVLGSKIESNTNVIKKIILQGSEVGAHTTSHKKLHNSSYSEITLEIEPVVKLIKTVYSELDRLNEFKKIFRSPHGFKNIALKRYLKSNSIKLIPWTRGVWDTDAPGSKWIFEKATFKPKKNEIILLHDGLGLKDVSKEQKQGVLKALPKIIDFYKNNGYTFIKVSDYLK